MGSAESTVEERREEEEEKEENGGVSGGVAHHHIRHLDLHSCFGRGRQVRCMLCGCCMSHPHHFGLTFLLRIYIAPFT